MNNYIKPEQLLRHIMKKVDERVAPSDLTEEEQRERIKALRNRKIFKDSQKEWQ